MAQDRKLPALKTLQGAVWKDGYSSGRLLGAMFDDVPAALRRWHDEGTRVYIFSSGSRAAQRLIFQHSTHGDLSRYLSGYFEPASVGGHAKGEPAAYEEIAKTVGHAAADVLFCTDVLAEAEAASSAGMQPCLLLRPGNAPLPPHAFRTATSLADC